MYAAAQGDALEGIPKLDKFDLKILATLQANGRITYQELGELIGLSASPCIQRVKRLESAGYIVGYGAWIELHKLRGMTTVFTSVTLDSHTQPDFLRFETGIRAYEELIECHLVSGGFDYLLKFMVPSLGRYQEIIEEVLGKQLGVSKYFSYIVIKTPVAHRYAPVSLATTETPDGSRS